MNILLTGGMGFIGSHTAVSLIETGHNVIIYDNLSNASTDVLNAIEKITNVRPLFIHGDIRDNILMIKTLRKHAVDVVIHFAGLKAVGESCAQPLEYYDNNVAGTVKMLMAMRDANVKRLIFSSSSTVYGTPQELPITEEHPLGGVTNPYGRTKLMIEEILLDLCNADPNFSVVCLRYFNPIGAHASGLIGENPNGIPNNLLPYVARVASGKLACLQVFGNNYPTADGTGVRDYIHVVDLAEGHVCAVEYVNKLSGFDAINLGTGHGYSVLEIVHTFEKVCGRPIPYQIVPRRLGDIAANWADPSKAQRLLGWRARHSLEEMCSSAWHFEIVKGKKEKKEKKEKKDND